MANNMSQRPFVLLTDSSSGGDGRPIGTRGTHSHTNDIERNRERARRLPEFLRPNISQRRQQTEGVRKTRSSTEDSPPLLRLQQPDLVQRSKRIMASMLQFPPWFFPISATIKEPPYLKISIYGKDVSGDLPSNMPAKLFFHFVPKASEWVVSTPMPATNLIGHVYIDIPDFLFPLEGLKYVILAMLRVSHIKPAPEPDLTTDTEIISCTRMIYAWKYLGLPPAGAESVVNRVTASVLFNMPSVPEIEAIWRCFPPNSIQVSQSLARVADALMDGEMSEVQTARFRSLVDFEPELGKLFSAALQAARMKNGEGSGAEEREGMGASEPRARGGEIMERGRTLFVSPEGVRRRRDSDSREMRRRMERQASVMGRGRSRSVEAVLGIEGEGKNVEKEEKE